MCGVFYIDTKMFCEIQGIAGGMEQRLREDFRAGDIHPLDYAPVLTAGREGIQVRIQRWGYPGVNGKGIIFNARVESVLDKRLFWNGIRYHRVVIPARHFYEWNARREKNVFSAKDGKVLYLAGFCDQRENEDRFVILTTAANASMQKVHDRMPLLLRADQLDKWLYDNDSLEELLKQTPQLLQRSSDYEQMTLF